MVNESDIGYRLQCISKVLLLIGSLIGGMVLLSCALNYSGDGWSLLAILGSIVYIILNVIICYALYGLGQLLDNTYEIKMRLKAKEEENPSTAGSRRPGDGTWEF